MTVQFKKDTHQYVSDAGELISVSKFMHLFKEEVDWEKKAINKSKNLLKYEGIKKTPKQILKEWEKKKILGSQAGTIVHDAKETERLGKSPNVKTAKYHGDIKVSSPLLDLEDGWIYPELMVYNFDYMICGQSDEVEIVDNKINIIDYKTDKEIKFNGYSTKWTKPTRFKPPIQHLEECNGNEYSLKMSIYMSLIWKATLSKFKPGKIILRWCPIERDEDGYPVFYDGKPKIISETDIEIPYKRKEVADMLNYYKNGNIK